MAAKNIVDSVNYNSPPMFKRFLAGSVRCIPYSLRPRIRSLPGIAGLQRRLIGRFLAGWPFVHVIDAGPAAGLRYEVTLPLDKAIWSGTHEPKFVAALASHVNPGDICYDLGGYRGYMAGIMALAGAANVFVFEPLPTNQQALGRVRELNPGLPIDVIDVAVGAVDGRASLRVMSDSSMGKLAGVPFQERAASILEIPVEVRQIDSLVEKGEIPPPHVMKIDVEGAEVDVLKGAFRVVRESQPRIFLEAHSQQLEEACTQQLSQVGYEVRRIGQEVAGEETTRHLVCLP